MISTCMQFFTLTISFWNNIFHSPHSNLRCLQNSSYNCMNKENYQYNHDQSNSPTHYISKPDIDIYQYRPIKRWLELPKTTQIKNDIFEKVLKCGGRTLRNLQAGRNCSLGTRVRSDYSWVLAKGDPGNTYGKACQAYCRQKSKGVSVRTIDVNYISRIWPHGFGPPPYNHNERSKFHMDNGNRRW